MAIRAACRETTIGPHHFVYPLFVHEQAADVPIGSMPGCARLSPASLLAEVERARGVGVKMIALFPAIDEALKDPHGRESYNPDGLVPRKFKSFWHAANEAGISRMYGGIHFRAAIELGLEQGRCIGEYAAKLKTRK